MRALILFGLAVLAIGFGFAFQDAIDTWIKANIVSIVAVVAVFSVLSVHGLWKQVRRLQEIIDRMQGLQ